MKLMKRQRTGLIINLSVMVFIFIFLLSYFKPELILSKTTISGGDTGSHNYLVYYLRDYLLPHGKIVGWSPGWYAGIPMFNFYFPLSYLLMVSLGYLIPIQISVKIITVLGTFLMPVATFASMKLMRFKFPMPIIAAIFTLPFLFMEANSMWGGNIPSTLAGEFSYSLSFSLMILFFGTLYHGIKSSRMIITNSILFAAITLTHAYTMIFAPVSSLFFILERKKKNFIKNFKYLFKVYIITFLLVAFWLLPLLSKIQYRTPFDYIWTIGSIKEVFPNILLPFYALATFGAYKGIKRKDERVLLLLFAILMSMVLYKLAILLKLTDIRFVPFLQFFPLLLAAYAISEIKKQMNPIFVLVVLLVVTCWVANNTTFIDYWIKWNYSGFESKEYWPQLKNITDYLTELPPGRVVHEFSNVHDKFGTVRTLEDIPLFTGKPVLEGLTIESAVNAPFVFWIQSEISKTPTCPLPRMQCSYFNLENGIEHLKLFNVNYLIATSDKLKNETRNNMEVTLLKIFDDIEIYRINNTGRYVEVAKNEPVLVKTKNWKSLSLEWFKRMDLIDTPLVFSSQHEDRFKLMIENDNLNSIKKIPVNSNCWINERVSNEEVKIKTNCIGKPLLVKISYFPNWKVEGANKVYLVSPAFMLIYPEQENVRLYYGDTTIDIVGKILSVLGLIIVILYFTYRKFSNFLTRV